MSRKSYKSIQRGSCFIKDIFAYILSPIVENLNGETNEAQKAAKAVEKWIFELGATQKLKDEGFCESDIDKIVDLTFTYSVDSL